MLGVSLFHSVTHVVNEFLIALEIEYTKLQIGLR